MMTIQQAVWQWFKYKKTDDYQYVQVSISPYLAGSETLRTMYRNAVSNKQKECILEHIEQHKEITLQFPDYRTLKRRIENDLKATVQNSYSNEEIQNAIGLLSDLELETKESYKGIIEQLQDRL